MPRRYVAGVTAPQYGMPMCGTPIGLPGPPHVPLGVPAGLQRHEIVNHTCVCLPEPTARGADRREAEPGLLLSDAGQPRAHRGDAPLAHARPRAVPGRVPCQQARHRRAVPVPLPGGPGACAEPRAATISIVTKQHLAGLSRFSRRRRQAWCGRKRDCPRLSPPPKRSPSSNPDNS